MADLIQREDNLNTGREKLNKSIKDSNKAKEDAVKALAKSLSAEQIAQLAELKSDDTQQQLDNIIIESGTSDAEVIQARGEHELLYKRFEDNESQLEDNESQLAETVVLLKPSMTTQQIQNLLNVGGTFKFVKGEYFLDFLPLYDEATCLDVQHDSEIFFEKGAILKGPTNNLEYYRIINIEKKNNVIIHDSFIKGDKHNHTGGDGEWGHGIVIRGSKRVTLNNCYAETCWGDGLYIGESTDKKNPYSQDITINNFIGHDNRRQGISVISVKGLRINDPKITDTSGTDPSAGIDIEPNHNGNYIENVVINSPYTENNKTGVEINLSKLIKENNTKNISLVVNNHISKSDKVSSNIRGSLEGIAFGDIIINNPVYSYAEYTPLIIEWYSDLLANVIINNPKIYEANTRRGSSVETASAIVFKNRDTSNKKIGNIHLLKPDIYSMEYYPVSNVFVEPNSKLEKLFFLNPTRLINNYIGLRYGEFTVSDENNVLVYNNTSSIKNISDDFSKTYTNKGSNKITRFDLNERIEKGYPEITFQVIEDYRMDIKPDGNSKIMPLGGIGETIHMRQGSLLTLKRTSKSTWQITNLIGEVVKEN